MASRSTLSIFWASLSLLAIVSLMFLLSGCPQPIQEIEFRAGENSTKELRLKVIDTMSTLKLRGATGTKLKRAFKMELLMQMEYPKLKGLLSFHPQNITAMFGEIPVPISAIHPSDKITKSYYECSISFSCIIPKIYFDDLIEKQDSLRLILDGVIVYNEKSVEIDTIYAILPHFSP